MPRFPLRKPSGPGRFRVVTLLGVVSLGCSAVEELSSMAVTWLTESQSQRRKRASEGSGQGFRLGLRHGASQGEELEMDCLGIEPSFRAVVSADSDFPANPPRCLGEISKRSPRANPAWHRVCSRFYRGATSSPKAFAEERWYGIFSDWHVELRGIPAGYQRESGVRFPLKFTS